jgi:hypothetical protein
MKYRVRCINFDGNLIIYMQNRNSTGVAAPSVYVMHHLAGGSVDGKT